MSLLQPFPRPVGDIGLGAFSAEAPVITLDDLIQSDLRVTWDEAVSIIEELCVAARGMVMRPIPGASDIILNANGTVGIRHAAAGVADPVEAARRLAELLSGSGAPAPLRLFVSQAVSSGTYNSLAEFDDALAYFAKPGRQERVKAVYQRASEQVKLKPEPATEQVKKIPVAAPPPWYRDLSTWYQSRRRAMSIAMAVAGTAIIIVGLAVYAWPSGSLASSATPVAQAPADVPGTGVVAAAPTAPLTVDGQPSRGIASALEAARIPLTGSAAAIRYTGRSSGVPRRGYQGPALTIGEPRPAILVPAPAEQPPAGVVRAQPPLQRADGAAPTTSAPGVSASFAIAPTAESPSPIYSANDAAVQPALLTKPQLLPPPYGNGFGKQVRLELIISPTGTVERVRFLEAPQRMADMMILSSAKTWLFTPAVKEGQPVRYRTVMSWVAAP